MNKNSLRIIIASFLLWVLSSTSLYAEGLALIRTHAKPENVMLSLQETLRGYGYKIAHIQKCDGGLQGMGYKTGYYKVVFFGKPEEVRKLTKKYPQLIPYLPLKIAIFAEKNDTLLTAVNPVGLSDFFADEEVKTQLIRWRNDIKAIFSEVRQLHVFNEEELQS
jgi:uncharacterized protein (DUF302 family)